MEYLNKLKALQLPEETVVTLSYSAGCDVFIHKGTAVDEAIRETDVVQQFADLVDLFEDAEWLGVVRELIDAEFIDEDELRALPKLAGAAGMIADAIVNNFDGQRFVESSVEQHDHKRGYCTLTAKLDVSLRQLVPTAERYEMSLEGWEIAVPTPSGTLTIEG